MNNQIDYQFDLYFHRRVYNKSRKQIVLSVFTVIYEQLGRKLKDQIWIKTQNEILRKINQELIYDQHE